MLFGELPEVKLDAASEPLRGFRFNVANPPKSAVLRLPTPDEMLTRLATQKSVRHSLGRRKSKTEPIPNPKADLDLFNRIRQDKGAEFDEYEASSAIRKLIRSEVTACERAGEGFTIRIKTPFGEVAHAMAIPSERDLFVYRRGVLSSVDLPHNQEELHYRYDVGVSLFDACSKSFTGYAPDYKLADVPPNHKFDAVVELVNAVEELDADLNPNS